MIWRAQIKLWRNFYYRDTYNNTIKRILYMKHDHKLSKIPFNELSFSSEFKFSEIYFISFRSRQLKLVPQLHMDLLRDSTFIIQPTKQNGCASRKMATAKIRQVVTIDVMSEFGRQTQNLCTWLWTFFSLFNRHSYRFLF